MGLFNPFWLGVGIMAKILFLSPIAAFHLARLFTLPVLLVVMYYVAAFFFKEKLKRKISFLFLTFASGWGWLLADHFKVLDFNVPEAFPITAMYSSAHFEASLGLLLLVFLFSVQAFSDYRLRHSLLAGICALTLLSFHPYHTYTIFGVLGAYMTIELLRQKRLILDHIKHLVIVAVFSLPAIAYYLWALVAIPVKYEHFLQNVTLTPNFFIVAISYGMLLPLALIGVFSILQKKDKAPQDIFLVVWFFSQFALLFLPIKTQIRLAMGLQCAMVLLTIHGIYLLKENALLEKIWLAFFGTMPPFIGKAFACIAFFIFFCLSPVLIFANDFHYYAQANTPLPLYTSQGTHEAILWLNNTPENSVILSTTRTGNLIPAASLRQIFLGHHHETAHWMEKELVFEYFLTIATDEERIMFLRQYGIDYFFFGPEEKKLATFDPSTKSFFEKTFENELVTIFKVK